MTEEEMKAAFNCLRNPLAKIKRGSQFDYKFVAQRLDAAGLRKPYPIALDEKSLMFTFSRYYITELYGGSFVETFPVIAKGRAELHGVNDFMMLPIHNHPHAPQNASEYGLFFSQNAGTWEWTDTHRVFVGLRPGLWLHMGFYRMYPSEPLVTEEFQRQDLKVKRTWAKQILEKGWGEDICLRVWWRRQRDEGLSDKHINVKTSNENIMQKVKAEVMWEDIVAAYERGEEQIGVWCMKCVGYDIEFQQVLVNNYDNFVPPSNRNKGDKKKLKGGKGKATASKKE